MQDKYSFNKFLKIKILLWNQIQGGDGKLRNQRKSLKRASSIKSLSNVPDGNKWRDATNNAANVSNVSSASASLDNRSSKGVIIKTDLGGSSLPSTSAMLLKKYSSRPTPLPTIPEKVVSYAEDDTTMTESRKLYYENESTTVDILKDWTASQTSDELHSEFNPDDSEIPWYISVLVLSAYVFVGGIVFSAWREDYDLLIGCYFSFITLSTIGFGDYVFGDGRPVKGSSGTDPEMNLAQLVVTGMYIFFGIAILSTCLELMHKGISRSIDEGKLGFWERFERYGQGTKQQRAIHRLRQRLQLDDRKILAILRKQEARRQAVIAMRRYNIAYAMCTAWVADNPKLFPLLENTNVRRDKPASVKTSLSALTDGTEI